MNIGPSDTNLSCVLKSMVKMNIIVVHCPPYSFMYIGMFLFSNLLAVLASCCGQQIILCRKKTMIVQRLINYRRFQLLTGTQRIKMTICRSIACLIYSWIATHVCRFDASYTVLKLVEFIGLCVWQNFGFRSLTGSL